MTRTSPKLWKPGIKSKCSHVTVPYLLDRAECQAADKLLLLKPAEDEDLAQIAIVEAALSLA